MKEEMNVRGKEDKQKERWKDRQKERKKERKIEINVGRIQRNWERLEENL